MIAPRSLLIALSSLALVSCVQRAVTAPPLASIPDRRALTTLAPSEAGWSHFIVHPEKSRLAVTASGLVVASRTLTVESFRGEIATDPSRSVGRLAFDADLRTIHGEPAWIAERAKRELLEVDRFPAASFAAWFKRGDGADERVVQGNLHLHGIERGVRFVGVLKPETDGARVDASFTLSRREFGIHLEGTLDDIVDDDVKIEVSLFAQPERVTVEVPSEPAR